MSLNLDLAFSISSAYLRIPVCLCWKCPLFCNPPFSSSLSTYYFSNVTACTVSLIALNPVRMLAASHQKHSWRWGAGVDCHVKSPPSLPLGKDLNLKHFQSITVQERALTMFCNTDWFHKICWLDAEVEFLFAYFIIKGNACAVFIVIQIWHK